MRNVLNAGFPSWSLKINLKGNGVLRMILIKKRCVCGLGVGIANRFFKMGWVYSGNNSSSKLVMFRHRLAILWHYSYPIYYFYFFLISQWAKCIISCVYESKILMNYRIKVDFKIKPEKSSNQHINIFSKLLSGKY